MKRIYFLLVYCILIASVLNGQTTILELSKTVLINNIVNKPYSTLEVKKRDTVTEKIITYIGQVNTSGVDVFKIVTYKLIWGPNKHTSGRILVFNKANKFIAQYQLGDGYDLPTKLKNGVLIFSNKDKQFCDKKLQTEINFKKGLPKRLFIKCEGELGDLYDLSYQKLR